MNGYILVAILLVGPPQPVEKTQLTILVDSKSKDPFIKKASEVIRKEPSHKRKSLEGELYYIRNFAQIKILEFEDNQHFHTKLPAFRFSKNNEWHTFATETFGASGTYTLSLYSILKMDEWERLAEIFNTEDKIYLKAYPERPTFLKNQPPVKPFLYPETFKEHYEDLFKIKIPDWFYTQTCNISVIKSKEPLQVKIPSDFDFIQEFP